MSRELLDEGAFGLAGWVGQTQGMAAAHRHLDLEINYVLAGTMIYLIGGRLIELPHECLCLLWGGVPHQMLRRPQTVEAIWITIPLTIVLRWGLPDSLVRPLLTTGFVQDATPRPGDRALLHQWITDLPGRVGPRAARAAPHPAQQIALLEIEARLRRLALGLATAHPALDTPPSPAAHAERGLAAVEAMAQFIAAHFQDDIRIGAIAGAAFLHPNYAMTLFRQHTGMRLSQYLVLQRVAHAQRLLATTGDPIATVAAASGFGSLSRFYEAFTQQTGTTPRRFRLQTGA